MASKKPVIALMYDFDKTLSPRDMQEYSFIPSLGIKPAEFWAESNRLAQEERMDRILAYMYLMIRKSRGKQIPITRDTFVRLGESLAYYPGVEDWFDRVTAFGAGVGVTVEHYIISSGLKEILEGCPIAKKFREIYACEFHYDENGTADWPQSVVNYTTKTQFLFRINKGVLDVSDDDSLNRYLPDGERRIPFRNMIYIGDGLTDVPCMKLVKVNGGQSIAVYPKKNRSQVRELLRDGRVDYIFEADYRADSALERTVQRIIARMAVTDELDALHRSQCRE